MSRRARFYPLFLVAFLVPSGVSGQDTPTVGELARDLNWRQIGPAVMGGRVSDLAVNEANPAHFFVGTATGGLWKTTSNGQDWESVFDDQSTSSIGDVTLAPSNPNVVWVGTGEPQNRQSSPYGAGVFRSTDGGRSWSALGLVETRHIGRIAVHPTDPDVAYVAAVGHLWGPNPERGVFRTTDGGQTWEKVLYIDEHTGAIDVVMDPGDPRTLFAATYQRQRTVWGYSADGPGSGIYRTTDGGDSWTELSNGLPDGPKGRIGLDVFRGDGNIVYALVESNPEGRGLYRSTDRGESWQRMSGTNPRPMYFSLLRIDPNDAERIYIGGVQFGISDDGGRTFRQGDGAPGIHVDHHALWIDPANSNHLLLGNDGGLATSYDRAAHWQQIDNLAIGQFYEIGASMDDPYLVCGGLQDNSSWCTPNDSRNSYGIRNGDWENVSGGDGFYNKIDPSNPNIIYTESQGGNVSRYDRASGEAVRMRPVQRNPGEDGELAYRFNWNTPIHVSTHDPATVYLGANHLLRSRNQGVTWEEASPDLTRMIDRDTLPIMGMEVTGTTPSRHDGTNNYGNITTIGESPLTPDLIYVGTDDGKLQRTRDGGATWTDLTAGLRGLPSRTYASSVVASSAIEGRVYATFDGHANDDLRPWVFVSEDRGDSWTRIANGLPDESVNRIREHPRTPDLLFLGNEVGVFVSVDRGANWSRLEGNLPTVPVDDIVIHPRDNDLILGTHGRSIWILDDVAPLEHIARARTQVAELFPVQPVTTWSVRGSWRFWAGEFQGENPARGALIRYWLGEGSTGVAAAVEAGDGGATARGGRSEGPTLVIMDASGSEVRTLTLQSGVGLHEILWDLRIDPPYASGPQEPQGGGGGGGRFGGRPVGPHVLPGMYTARLQAGGSEWTTEIEVRPDPRVPVSESVRADRQDALLRVHSLAEPVFQAGMRIRALNGQLTEIEELLEGDADAPASLATEVEGLQSELRALQEALGDQQGALSLRGAIEGSSTRPTDDQLWQISEAESAVPGLVERLNAVITERMPALNRELDANGIRPEPGEPISVPRKRGGGP